MAPLPYLHCGGKGEMQGQEKKRKPVEPHHRKQPS
jgi:hypothetical protein